MIFLIFTRLKEAFMDDFLILVNNVTNIDLKIFFASSEGSIVVVKNIENANKM